MATIPLSERPLPSDVMWWDVTPWVKYQIGVIVVTGLVVMLVASFWLGLIVIGTAALGWTYWRWLEARQGR